MTPSVIAQSHRPPSLLAPGARPGGGRGPRRRAAVLVAPAARRNDTAKGPRHETRPSAANVRSRSRPRRGRDVADPLVPEDLLREGQETEGERPPACRRRLGPPFRRIGVFFCQRAPPQKNTHTHTHAAFRYARALVAAVAARRRPLALRTALALAVARPGRLLVGGAASLASSSSSSVAAAPPGGRPSGGGGGGVRPAALAARLVQLSETLGISVADAAELLAGASGPEDDDNDGAFEQQQQQQRRQQRQQQKAPRRSGAGRAASSPPPPALEDVLPLRLLRAAEALVAALELDLDDDDEEGGHEDEKGEGRDLWAGGAAAAAAAAAATWPPPLPTTGPGYRLPPEPPQDPRADSLRLALRAMARRPALLDASPLDARRGSAAVARALGLPPRLAARRLVAREPALLEVAPGALAKRAAGLARALSDGPEGAGEALALALALREPRLLLPPARALAANVAALPRALLLPPPPPPAGPDGADPGTQHRHPQPLLPLLLLHAPALALVPAAELARRREALGRLLPPPPPDPPEGPPAAPAGPPPPSWPPLLRTACGLEYDPRLLTLAPARLAERARHLQRLERLAAADGAGAAGSGGDGDGEGLLERRRQRRARLLAVSSAALDGWCADALHLRTPLPAPSGSSSSSSCRAAGAGVAAASGEARGLAEAARRLLLLQVV